MQINDACLKGWLMRGQREGCFPSAAAAIGAGEETLATAFAGGAPLPNDAPVDAHTRWDMASLSKVIGTSVVALRAIARDELALTDRVGDFFPDAPGDKADITLEMLMTHTGGFVPAFWLEEEISDPRETAAAILRHPLEEKPGVRPIYSCMGYILLAKILERRFGEPLDALARREVFEPLGMAETGYCPPKEAVCAATEVNPATGRPWIGVVHDENARFQGGVSGNAGIFMPLCDGIRFAKMCAALGEGYLPRPLMEEAIRNHTPGQDQHRGLGFHLAGTPDCFFSNAVPEACFGHTGFTGTSLLVEPATGFWVLLLTNRVYPTRESTALFAFRRKLHAAAWEAFRSGR